MGLVIWLAPTSSGERRGALRLGPLTAAAAAGAPAARRAGDAPWYATMKGTGGTADGARDLARPDQLGRASGSSPTRAATRGRRGWRTRRATVRARPLVCDDEGDGRYCRWRS